MAMMLVDGVELPTPSTFEWGMIDVSASDSGRTQDAKMHKNRIAQKRQLNCHGVVQIRLGQQRYFKW